MLCGSLWGTVVQPENVLLGRDGHLCLTDFGLAKELSSTDDRDGDGKAK